VLEVTSLGSGSCGNALLVRTASAVLLVDCGVGIRRLATALAERGLGVWGVDALLISHEHSDHVRELPRFTAASTPLLSSKGTALATGVARAEWRETRPHRPVAVGDVEIVAIPVAHDAAEPCGFLIRSAHGAVTIVTDLGSPSAAVREAIAASDLVVLEANHDVEMVRRGPYPRHLQRRVLSDSGHLSNVACGELIASALHEARRLPAVWLAHLSETNNRPQLALRTVQRRLAADGFRLDVSALPRRDVSATWRPDTAPPGIAQLALGF
jgi:phosphoribosyl 1,2-cyclic phosphodiesterase